MGTTRDLYGITDLSLEEIHKVLFDGIEIEKDPRNERGQMSDHFYCQIDLVPIVEVSEPWVLASPENLVVIYEFGWDVESYKAVMKSAMNWFKHTCGDCAFTHEVEVILLSRVNGKVVRNNSGHTWFPKEVVELIDIPHEVKDLGIL